MVSQIIKSAGVADTARQKQLHPHNLDGLFFLNCNRKMQTDSCDFPVELCSKPQALIGVSGLDTRNNAIHKSIWETFTSNRRVDSASVTYKLIDNAYEFPVVKPKRNSYEWYIPKGILKRNWLDKHLNRIPAVIVVFYDLDWTDAQWSEKMIECASRVQSMRVALEGRGTKLSIVLVQNKQAVPTIDDPLASERAAALCASCELNSKSLYILPHGDHLQGYAVRLETAFYELAQNYYLAEMRHIKSHRDHLNKATHQYLFVRHQFKMGFLSEMKQDIHTAHKHYTYAYNNLLEIRIVDTNAMEIRTVAGFINYKLCALMFALNLPRDAISQFKAHTDRFKTRLGFQELAFEHYAWMSKQYCMFGEIFDEAVKLGLPAVQTQHPGLYYQQAVQHAIARKKSCKELCSEVVEYPSPDPLEGIGNMEYYGQRPWRLGKVSTEPPDQQVEWNGIKALQHLETRFNHSNNIIALYGLAVSQFKLYRCPRTRRHLVVQMAEEYYCSRDYGKALTLLTHMLWDYRAERWWSLLSNILDKALRCAYLTGSLVDYVSLSLELLGPQITIQSERKKQIYENFNRVLRKQPPQVEANIPEGENAEPLWLKIMNNPKLHLPIEMSNITSCIDCKARFLLVKYQANEKVEVEVFVRNLSDFPINLLKIIVSVNNPMKSMEYVVDETSNGNPNFLFSSREIKRFLVQFTPQLTDINKELQVSSVNLYLGTMWNHIIDLKFTGLGNDISSIPNDLVHFRKAPKDTIDFDSVRPLLSTTIVPRNSKLSMIFIHAKPALSGEWYRIEIQLGNEKDFTVTNLEFEITLMDEEGIDSIEFSKSIESIPEKLPLTYPLSDLHPSTKVSLVLFMRSHQVGGRNLNVRASFNFLNEEQIPSLTEDVLHVPVVKPFEIGTRYLTALFEDATKFYVGEQFAVMPVINCLSPWPIQIESTHLEMNSNLQNADTGIKSQVAGSQLNNGESCAEIYLASTNKRSDVPITIGQYNIKWKRVDGQITSSQMMLSGLTVDWIPLDLHMTVPAHGLVRTPMRIEYQLKNKSQHLIQLDVSIEGSEAFMFAGYKQFSTTILPDSVRTLKYNLYPLIAGSVALPKLVLTVPESAEGPALRQEHLNALQSRSLPTHIFVMPQKKGEPLVPETCWPRAAAANCSS